MRKRAPSDQRISLLLSPEVEDEAPSRVPGGDEVVAPTPDKELSGLVGSMAAK